MDVRGQRAVFGADLAAAARALVSQPSVPPVSFLATVVPSLPTVLRTSGVHSTVFTRAATVIEYACMSFLLGWYGSERVFFQRQFAGKPAPLYRLLGLPKAFMGRFVALGLPLAAILLAFTLFAFSVFPPQGGQMPVVRFQATYGLLIVAMDFALTFVTPALAYTTRSARRALGIGFAMIRQTWPRCAFYVLCPPLALNIMHVVYPADTLGVQFALSAVLVLVGLLAKGAIAAFYLRERGSYSDDGAAYIPARDEPPGSVTLATPTVRAG
jgi:hypothetical protein